MVDSDSNSDDNGGSKQFLETILLFNYSKFRFGVTVDDDDDSSVLPLACMVNLVLGVASSLLGSHKLRTIFLFK